MTVQTVRPATEGELVTRLSEQSSTLVRNEARLAVAEMQQKAKQAGVGAELFGTAGVVALFAIGALIATAISGLALVGQRGWPRSSSRSRCSSSRESPP